MSAIVSLRRMVLLIMLAAAAGATLAWWRGRSSTPVPADRPQWPPLAAPEPTSGETNTPPDAEPRWREADDDGGCPAGFVVKAKISSGIYHLPGGRFYERTRPDRCYADAGAAEADGYRRSKS